MTLTNLQLKRFIEYLEEVKECHELCKECNKKEWDAYFDAWINPSNNFTGYVKKAALDPLDLITHKKFISCLYSIRAIDNVADS